MKSLSTVLLALICAGCAADANDTNWTPVVLPYDPPVSECTKPLPPVPQPELRAHSGKAAATAYKNLQNSYVDLSKDYEKCQTWAKGQR